MTANGSTGPGSVLAAAAASSSTGQSRIFCIKFWRATTRVTKYPIHRFAGSRVKKAEGDGLGDLLADTVTVEKRFGLEAAQGILGRAANLASRAATSAGQGWRLTDLD